MKIQKLRVLNVGVSGAQSEAEANRIRLTNLVALLPLIIFIFSTVYSIYGNYPRIVFVNCIAIAGTLIAVFCNFKRKYSIAKSIIISVYSFTTLVYYKLMMDEPSVFFYYFIIVLAFIIFYDPDKEKKILMGTISFVTICIVLTIWLPNRFFKPFPLSASLHHFLFIFNSCVCIFLCAFFVYRIFRVNIINEKLLLEAKTIAEQAAQAKTTFLSNMSHELRTPLNGIIGTTHILQNETYLPSQEYNLAVLANLSQHILGLVNNVLDFSKIDAGRLELNGYRFNMSEFTHKLHNTFYHLSEDKGIRYQIDVDDRLAVFDVFADELRLQQVMNNLISNALKFTHRNGAVTVSVSMINQTDESVKIFFSVSDDGIGISAENQAKIFESFSQGDSATTRKYGGSGLGLTISRNLIKLFGGSLQVNSVKGKGSQFYFDAVLPLYISQQDEVNEQNGTVQENLKNFKVLIAEDNKVNMIVATKTLERWGIQVTGVENGQLAYDKCLTEDFDLLLLDLEMPVMDGRTAVKKINALAKSIPVIAFTAGVYENMSKEMLAIGFSDYLLKPFMPDDLYRKIIAVKNNAGKKEMI